MQHGDYAVWAVHHSALLQYIIETIHQLEGLRPLLRLGAPALLHKLDDGAHRLLAAFFPEDAQVRPEALIDDLVAYLH